MKNEEFALLVMTILLTVSIFLLAHSFWGNL